MTTSAPRPVVISLLAAAIGALTFTAAPAWANDKADCAAALKSAQAEQKAGTLTKALTDLETCSRPVCPKPTQKQCGDLTRAVLASQPSVIFSAKDANGKAVTSVTVTVDGTVVTSNLDGTAIVLDPGSHAMKFEMDGATTVEKQIDVAEVQKGQAIAIDLDANKAAAAPIVVVAPLPSEGSGSMTDTTEDPTKRYYFIGLRYRGDVIPQFMLNIFVNGGKTLYSNSIGAEIDLRHDHFSLIPAITYTEYGTGDILFAQKSEDATQAGNWSLVNSSLKGLYFSADLLWSTRIADHWDFEYGAGFGLGVIFGTLEDNWVYNANSAGGTNFNESTALPCTTAQVAAYLSCQSVGHKGNPPQINGYNEASWVNGGSKPSIFPLINFPQLGVRYKPIKQMEARLGIGFSLTGFWFGLSANYGLEKTTK
jgi:hypothetical protein